MTWWQIILLILAVGMVLESLILAWRGKDED